MRITPFFPSLTLIAILAAGCHSAHPSLKPAMSAGEGGISGQLVDSNNDPFDLGQAGDDGARSLRIDLRSPEAGVVAASYPKKDESRFTFSHVKPGQYELSVYLFVPGKRTIAGSLPVTVNPDQVTPVKLPLAVTALDSAR